MDYEVYDYELKSLSLVYLNYVETKKTVQATHLKEKIIIIENNAELRRFAVEYLSDYFKAYEAENGEEVLKNSIDKSPINQLICGAFILDNFKLLRETYYS